MRRAVRDSRPTAETLEIRGAHGCPHVVGYLASGEALAGLRPVLLLEGHEGDEAGRQGLGGERIADKIADPPGADDGRIGLHPTKRGEDDSDVEMRSLPQGDVREPEVGGTRAGGTADAAPDGSGPAPDEKEDPPLDVGTNRPVVKARPLEHPQHRRFVARSAPS